VLVLYHFKKFISGYVDLYAKQLLRVMEDKNMWAGSWNFSEQPMEKTISESSGFTELKIQ
jgi:hypothetical protein